VLVRPQEFRSAVEGAVDRPEVYSAVHNLYVALQDAIDLRKPICVSSGRCCRFDEFGHNLFVTTLEMATFVQDLRKAGPFRGRAPCAFQQDKLCSVHSIRPFGCRIFFCDVTSTTWQQDQYVRFHNELKRLHIQLEVPYFYVEWRQALRILAAYVDSPTSL
jgi:Fe-S-cluster containining protein